MIRNYKDLTTLVLKTVKAMFKLLNFKNSLAFQDEKYQGLNNFVNNIIIMASYKSLNQQD